MYQLQQSLLHFYYNSLAACSRTDEEFTNIESGK